MHEALIEAAKAARRHAYAPYSGFRVGAALLDENGAVHLGCNVENVAFGATLCAEAGAISAMIAAGGRKIEAIAVVGGKTERMLACMPCGSCRQRIREFATERTQVVTIDPVIGAAVSHSIASLLPLAYDSNDT